MKNRPVYYMQTDPKWKNMDYSAPGETTTIGRAGCGPTSASMVVATLVDRNETPTNAAKWSLRNGFKAKNQGTYHTFFKKYFETFGLKCRQLTSASVYHTPNAPVHIMVREALINGDLIIACMGKGRWTSSGHYVLAWNINGNYVMINDPNSTASNKTKAIIREWQNEVKHYWVIEVPNKQKPINEKVEDDEVIVDKTIKLFNKDKVTKTIFKEGTNFVPIRLMESAGFKVSSEGDKPVVDVNKIKVNVNGKDIEIPGFNADGTTYLNTRELVEALGAKVGWENNKVTIKS